MGSRYPIKQTVSCYCPQCRREVQHDRSVYPDAVYYTCLPKRHHWTYYPAPGEQIPGGGFIAPPRGWNDEDS